MLLSIDLQSDTPIYTQLVDQLLIGMARGELKPGMTLPSVRSMAADLGINLHTVNKAYNQLKQDGFLVIHRNKGAIVNPDGFPEADDLFQAKIADKLRTILAEAACRGMSIESFTELCAELYEELQQPD